MSKKQGKRIVKTPRPYSGGFNRKIYDQVNELIKVSGRNVMENSDNILSSIRAGIVSNDAKRKFSIYKKAIIYINKEIDKIENKCNIYAICTEGCAYCCNQAIYVSNFESKIIKEHIKNLSHEKKKEIKESAQAIFETIKIKNIPINMTPFYNPQNNHNKYLELNIPCPLLGKDNLCMVYESRPIACYSFRNYGVKQDCINKIAPHSYAFQEYLHIIRKLHIVNIRDYFFPKLLPVVLSTLDI